MQQMILLPVPFFTLLHWNRNQYPPEDEEAILEAEGALAAGDVISHDEIRREVFESNQGGSTST